MCGRWVLEVGIDWGMFSDILDGFVVGVWRRVIFCWTVVINYTYLLYVHMPKNADVYGGLYIANASINRRRQKQTLGRR